MDEDPDDLAAAFFAAQAAKEKAKATLPTDDWIRVVAAAGVGGEDGAGDDRSTDPASWPVTAAPPEPARRDGSDGGVVGIAVDRPMGRARCRGPGADEDAARDGGGGKKCPRAEEGEAEMRRRIKEYLVRKLEETMDKAT